MWLNWIVKVLTFTEIVTVSEIIGDQRIHLKKLWRFLNQVICFRCVFHWYKYYHHIWTSNKKFCVPIESLNCQKVRTCMKMLVHQSDYDEKCTRNSFINNSIAQLLFGPLGASCDIRAQYTVQYHKKCIIWPAFFSQNTLWRIYQRSGCFHWKFSISPRKCHW